MPPPLRKPSPGSQHQHTSRLSSSPAPPIPRSSSLSPSPSDSDDDFVYVLEHVDTTEEAVERIRAVQQPKEKNQGRLLGGIGGSAKSLTELVTTSPNKYPASWKLKGELPATMQEFYESPRYTVTLAAAREALFSDALSGFHSYVAREEAERDPQRALPHHHHSHYHVSEQQGAAEHPVHYVRLHSTQSGIACTSTIPSLSPTVTQEWNSAVATPPVSLTKPAATAVKMTGVAKEDCAQVSPRASAVPPSKRVESPDAPSTTADPDSPSPSTEPAPTRTSLLAKATLSPDVPAEEAVTASVAEKMEPDSQRIPASYIFLMRSRDTEAMIPVSSAAPHSVILETRALPPLRDSCARGRASADSPGNIHVDTAASAAALSKAVKQPAMQPHPLLQEGIYQRTRVPVVFRYRYSPDFEETIEENKLRHQQLDRALRNHQRLAGSRGLTNAERQEISRRFADPNALAHEWLYVWEQFERDIPRETLFVEDTPYHDPKDALAAILSYVEHCYDRCQQRIQEKSAAALAAEKNGRATSTVATALGGSSLSATPASPNENLFDNLFSVSAAAFKGAVVKMRGSLPDFVGDPLLSFSGYDPGLYHASLLFPTDPRARSEKIFSAVREVVLASQQSFMGFPYQLLCEQVGTERLGLALEALERDQAEDDDLDEETEAEKARVTPALQVHRKGKVATSASDASAAISTMGGEVVETTRKETSSSVHPPLHASRVLRVYHSSPSSTSVTNRSVNGHHHRQHTAHAVDEWDMSSSSSRSSGVALCSLSPDISQAAASPATTSLPPPPGDSEECTEEKDQPLPGRGDKKLLARTSPVRRVGKEPPAVLHIISPHRLSEELRRRETVARLRRERRRRRREQLPLLVGEPRPHEFAAFLDIVRRRVMSKQLKEERQEMEQRRRERVQRMLKRQCEHWRSAPASSQGSQPGSCQTSRASVDMMQQTNAAFLAATAPLKDPTRPPRKLFYEDVEGSAYLIPTRAASTTMEPLLRSPRSPLSSISAREVPASPETRGMRICLFFDDKRNVPVVLVNKLFRLFTMPGVRGLTSSEDDAAEVLNDETPAETGVAHPNASARKVRTPSTGSLEKSLLLLIQVQFSLFSQEDAEVRWKWWKL
ncbi:hypothetical protein GH5_01818 [Leishmania sp. Ghana 2012 LV757]|uniref:hypothetical protein n=1 Tax=Leishmania sp. Ghana 2012 LV757 TaxID=2803181 RepID=UPI001B6FC5ED|nr:hypothetical protein GH5_01818 [Leishmania sp. Ghana 2012 LV757]